MRNTSSGSGTSKVVPRGALIAMSVSFCKQQRNYNTQQPWFEPGLAESGNTN